MAQREGFEPSGPISGASRFQVRSDWSLRHFYAVDFYPRPCFRPTVKGRPAGILAPRQSGQAREGIPSRACVSGKKRTVAAEARNRSPPDT